MHFLQIDWATLLPALVLLFTPVALFHGAKVDFRESDRDWGSHVRKMARLWLHYFDLVRAALGMWLLWQSLHAAPGAAGLARYSVLLGEMFVLTLALALQTIPCRLPDSAHAPFAFAAGLVLGGPSPVSAGLALGITLPLVMGSRTASAFFPLLSIAYVGFGLGFGGKKLLFATLPTAVALLFPWLWALLFSRSLLVSYRPSSHRTLLPPPR